ncbi:hypothetical protein MNBD_NITROSPINAE02-699 [hydrothermal vent metagenome]|uniref:CBS domain-containing protein n=1 Tax=hydrothermal vent metagenome TaxID=652676 RepID=A0A3B1CHG5_9ZZZZ
MSDFQTLLAVKDLMSKHIETAPSTISVTAVAKLMAEKNISSVILTDGEGMFVGIVTEGDIVINGLAKDLDPVTTKASEIMNDDVEKIPGDTSIFEARKIMTDHKVKHLLVQEGGKPVGLISSSALLGG